MTPEKSKKSNWPWLIAAALCLVLAAFFKFALIGYSMIACCFAFLCLLIIAYHFLTKRGLKKLSTVLTVLLVIGAMAFIALEIPIISAAHTDDEPQADFIIVLGAGVNGTTPSLSMVNRLDAALDYLERYPDSRAILTGGQGTGESITEAEAMYIWLTARGVDAKRLIKEEQATTTEENLRFSLALVAENGGAAGNKVAICSSEYHLYRAKSMAKALGCTPVGVAGKTSYPVLKANYFIREALAVLYMWAF